MIQKISTLDMSREDWLEHRRHSIGGSDAATIVGLNPWSSRYELWADKLGKIPPKEENEAMRIGHDLEEYVAQRFCEATGKRVRRENAILTNTDIPFAHANVDRLVIGEKAGLECKTTSVLNLKRFAGGEYPPNYYVQCQHYMMVTGYKVWYLAVLVLGREFLWFEVKRDEEDIEALRAAEQDFWEYVDKQEPPAVDGTDSCGDTLDKLYPDSDPDVDIDLTAVSDALRQRSELCRQIKALESQKKACENSIKDYMETAEKGNCEGFKVSWKTQERISLDSKQLQADHHEIDFGKYIKTSSSRTMRITEVKTNG